MAADPDLVERQARELLACPFCGGEVDLEETVDQISDHILGERRKWWGVVCRNGTNLGGTCAIQQRPSASKNAAIRRWNTRATLASPATGGNELGVTQAAMAYVDEQDCRIRNQDGDFDGYSGQQMVEAFLVGTRSRLTSSARGLEANTGNAGGALIWTFTAEAFDDGTVNCEWHDVPGSEIHWETSKKAKEWIKSQIDEMVLNPQRCPFVPSAATHALIGPDLPIPNLSNKDQRDGG